MPDTRIMKLALDERLAWIGCERVFSLRMIGESGTGSGTWKLDVKKECIPFRRGAAEIYQRDDDERNPVWTMWHFYCSPLAAEDEPRLCFNDTSTERSLRANPWRYPLRVVGD